MTTASDIITAIDTAILSLVENEFEEVQVNGRRYKYTDLDKLKNIRTYYARIYRGGNSTIRLGDMNV